MSVHVYNMCVWRGVQGCACRGNQCHSKESVFVSTFWQTAAVIETIVINIFVADLCSPDPLNKAFALWKALI